VDARARFSHEFPEALHERNRALLHRENGRHQSHGQRHADGAQSKQQHRIEQEVHEAALPVAEVGGREPAGRIRPNGNVDEEHMGLSQRSIRARRSAKTVCSRCRGMSLETKDDTAPGPRSYPKDAVEVMDSSSQFDGGILSTLLPR
jgi:hypothetical protein